MPLPSALIRVRQRGFTLVELLCTIVILAVLAGTAFSRFTNFGVDSQKAVLARTSAEIMGAARMAHYKCLALIGCHVSAHGVQFTAPSGTIGSAWNGWPTGMSRPGYAQGIKDWISAGGFTVVEMNTAVTEFRLVGARDPYNCMVRYRETATVGVPPTVVVVDSAC